jgi:hypothetical protein
MNKVDLGVLLFVATAGCTPGGSGIESSDGGLDATAGTTGSLDSSGGDEALGDAGAADEGTNGSAALGRLDWSGLDPTILAGHMPIEGIDSAQARAVAMVAAMTPDQKIELVQGSSGAYVGNVQAVGALPPLTLQDGPAGVARFNGVTAFPSPITLAASWDRELVQRWGAAMGEEEHDKGVMIQLGPMMNMARVGGGGRNFEGFGEDPYLASELAAADVRGIQSQKVVATAKHFVGNEQETNRMTENSVIDERTLREIYEAPFEASVNAGVGAVMCSYNRINGTYACENPATLGDLKGEWGLPGGSCPIGTRPKAPWLPPWPVSTWRCRSETISSGSQRQACPRPGSTTW